MRNDYDAWIEREARIERAAERAVAIARFVPISHEQLRLEQQVASIQHIGAEEREDDAIRETPENLE